MARGGIKGTHLRGSLWDQWIFLIFRGRIKEEGHFLWFILIFIGKLRGGGQLDGCMEMVAKRGTLQYLQVVEDTQDGV